MVSPITQKIEVQKIEVQEFKQAEQKIQPTKTESFFYNEKFVHVATTSCDFKRQTFSENHGDWLVAALCVNNVFQWVTLFEYDYKQDNGQHVYKRSSFLPEMVQKVEFLSAIEKMYKKSRLCDFK